MFSHLLPKTSELFAVVFSVHAERHFLSRFRKSYKGKRWDITEDAIRQDLGRLRMPDNTTQQKQQIDELWHAGEYWIAKYDFAIAGAKESPKKSGNRCVIFIDNSKDIIEILMIFGKGDLPKNMGEQQFIEKTLREQFAEKLDMCRIN